MQRALSFVATFVAVLFTSAAAFAQSYTDDFQSYGEHANPPGWIDSSVGVVKPEAAGLYKTWGDPTQGNKATNVVYGTKQSSGKADPNGRMGTFSTYTAKSFTGVGRFEYRGRFIRTNSDSRIGLTFLSAYPEKDQYYLAGLMPQSGGALTMQLLSFGAGTFTGIVDSRFTPNPNQWCWFAIQADATDSETRIRARFWVDGSTEPSSWSIDATDATAKHLSTGRIGLWAAIKGDAYVDDLNAKSAIDHNVPAISFFESNAAMTDNQVFNRDAAPEIRVTDDSSGVGDVTIKLDGNAYVSRTPVTGERYHQLDVDATDNAGNSAHATIHFAVDKSAPVVAILDNGTPIAAGAVLNHNVTPVISVTDLTPFTIAATLDGATFNAGTVVSAETQHTLSASVTDSAQHTTTRSVTFSIDKRGPSLTLVSHKDGDVVTETTIVLGGGADDAVQVKVNGVPAQLANGVWTSAPFSLVEGSNPITVTGVDPAGNTGQLGVTIALDTRAPQLVISSPAANACLDTTIVDLHGTVADPHAHDVSIQFGGATINATLDATGAWSANVPGVPEGKQVFLVIATDSIGHSTTVSRAVNVDRTEPVIDVDENGAPFTAKLINRAVSLDVRANDADPNVTLTVKLNGGATGASPVVVSAEGTHTLDITATDCAGLQSERKVTFTIDRTAPVITNLAPANGATIGAAPASIHGSSSEAATITIAGTTLSATVNAAGPFDLAGATLIEGVNRFTLHAVDDAGNATDVACSLTLRTIAPAIEIVDNGSPIANGALFNRSVAPVIRVNVSDATVTATLDGQPFTSGTTIASEGTHTINVTALDPAGHSTTASLAFTIDRTAPVVKITAPLADQTIDADHVTVTGNAGDAVSLTVNGSVVTPAAGGAFSTNLPLDLGENLIVATGRDRAGNSGADQVSVTRSDAGAGILLTLPVDRSSTNRKTTVVSGRILTPANATSLKIGAVSVPFDPTGAFTIPDFALVEGLNTITATLTSANGKTTSATTTITCDLTPPALRILAGGQTLDDDARFATSVTLTLDASDGATELRVDGSLVTTPNTVSATGAHTAIATATDAAGNQTRVRRYFTVGGQAGSGCTLDNFDPANNSVVAASSVTVAGSTGGAAGVKINGVPAAVANNSFSGTAELSIEGANAISIVCTDAAGAALGTAKTLTLIRVTNAPSITINSPNEMAIVGSAKIPVSGTIGAGVTEVTVNGAKATINGSAFTAEASLSAGLNIIVARAKNGAGRYGSASRRVVALLNAPSIGIDWPADGFITSAASVDISGTYTNLDPATIASSAGGILETHPGSDTSGSFVLRGVILSNGSQTITVTGRDAVAHSASAKVSVSRDGNAPSVVIATPFDGSYSPTASINVTGSVIAVDGSRVDIANVPATLTGTTFTGTATLGSGAATPVVARVTQPDGSSAIATSYVTLLSGAPTVTRFFPAADAIAVDPGVLVLAAFSAPMNRASLDDGFVLLDGAGAPISGQRRLDRDVLSFAPATTLTPGERYTIVVKTTAKDLAGNSVAQEQRSSFTIATTAPATAPQVDPIASPVCASQITISGNAPASSRLEIDISGIPQFTTADATGRFSAQVAIPAQSGYRVARVRVIGGDGSYSPSADAGFQVDCAGPAVTGALYDRNANTISVTFSKPIDLSTANAAVSLKLGNGTAVTSTVAAGASNSIVITPGSPDPRAQTLVLTIAASLKDTTGRALASAFTQTFTVGGSETGPSNGSGFISGQVLDATNGRPLAGANIAITPASITAVTDANGRYATAVGEGAYTIHASAAGFTDVWRQVVVPAGSGIVPIDIRLTARGNALTHGGDDSVTRKATLSLTNGVAMTVTSVGSQSLAGLLPLGWSPIAAAEVRASANGTATLAFELPAEAASSGRPFTAVEYDHVRDEWRVLQAAVAIDGQFSINATSLSSFALVYPDAITPPPVPVTGQVLAGVQDPCATQTCAALVTKDFPLNPKTVLPNGRTVATLIMEGTNNPYPSGTAVQAFVNEELTLLDGSVDTTQPFSTDLILYRSLDGATSSAAFHLAPSARAGAVPLQVGVDRISVYPYPGRLDRGTLVGPAGGPIPSDDRVQIDIPTGAAPSALHATATSIADLTAFTVPGFEVVGGFTLTLTGVGQAPSPVLLKPANVSFTINSVASGSQLVVAEVVSGTPYGRIFRMVANTNAPEPVAAPKVRVTTAAIDPSKLPLDGVVRPGQYLLLLAKQPVAFAFGSVRLGTTGGYLNGAEVTASPLGVADVSRPAGLFVIPVVAKPAATFALTPSYPSTGTGTAYSAPAVDAGLAVPIGDLVLASQPPALQQVNVIATSGGIDLLATAVARDVVLTTSVQAVFSQTVTTTNTSAIAVTDAAGNAIAGSVTVAGSTLTWTPAAKLAPNASYVVTIDGGITGAYGAPLGSTQSFAFSTVTQLTNDKVHPEKIHITIPDANGYSTITGEPGALPTVPPEPEPWRVVPLRRGHAFTTVFQATAANDGSFSVKINPVALTDRIDLEILNVAGNIVAILPLGPFSSPNGQAFIAPADESVTFTSRDGVAVTVPAGSFDEPTTIGITRIETAVPLANVPNVQNELNFYQGVRIDFSCAPCTSNNRLDVSIPVPPGSDPSRNYLLGLLGDSVRGPRVMIVDTLRITSGNFTTAAAGGSALRAQTQSAKRTGTQQVLTDADVKKYLMGVNRSGIYNVIDLQVPAGLGVGFAAIDGIQGNYDLFFDSFASLFESHEYLSESRGRIIVPVLQGKKFEIVGVDAATGLQSFSKIYDPLPVSGGVVSVISDPQSAQNGPYPIFTTPARIEIVELQAEGDITSIRNVTLHLEGGSVTAPVIPSNTRVSLFNATTGRFDATGTSVLAKTGDRLVVAIGEHDVDPRTPLQVVFSRPIYTGASTDANAIDAYLAGVIKVFRGPASADPIGAHFRVDSDGRRVTIELPAELERGADYRILLTSQIAAAGANGPGLGLGQIDADSQPIELTLFFHVRPVPDPIASFQVPSGSIRDLALTGNILLMSAGSGGILAYDAANPAALGANATPIGYAKAGATDFWAVAADHHGRVYATGTDSAFGFVQSYRLESFTGEAKPRSSAIVCWIPGYSSGLDLGSDTVLSDRPEGLPRRLQLAVQDDEVAYDNLAALAAATGATVSDAGNGFKKAAVELRYQRSDTFPYLSQRVTVENVTRALKWSADVTATTPVTVDVIAQPGDKLRILYNVRTYGVVTIFGYGIGVFDLNAMESNDTPNRTTAALSERVRLTKAALNEQCQSPTADAIQDFTFTPEVAVVPRATAGKLTVYGADVRKGVLDADVDLKTTATVASNGPVCDPRSPVGMLIMPDKPNANPKLSPRIDALVEAYKANPASGGVAPFARFGGIQTYVTATKTYLLVPAYQYGLLVLDTTRPPQWLDRQRSLVDILWVPAGAVAVRVVPGTQYATIVDSAGRVMLADLTRIDESAKTDPDKLFPSALEALKGSGAYGVGAPDLRILWTSDPGLVAGTLAPVVDPDTGILFAGQLQGTKTTVVATGDPRIRVLVRNSDGALSDTGGIVPLGVAPPPNVKLGTDGSLAAFKLAAVLPGGITDAVTNLALTVKSERVPGAQTEDTPQPLPPAHLHNVTLHRDLPDDPAVLAKLRSQRGFNRFTSDWIVAIADPRAHKDYWPVDTTAAQMEAAGCTSCARPSWLPSDAKELYSLGRYLRIEPEANVFVSSYSYLQGNQLEARVSSVPADTVRPTSVLVAAQQPPVAGGMLQETAYLHSGEVETNALDLDAGGRAGWNVTLDRTYRSRTIGYSPFGLGGWASSMFRHLRPLPNGNVEYRDGSGEVWTFKLTADGQYTSPTGLFLKLSRTDRGWKMVDQQWRLTEFDLFGRLSSESDEFYKPEVPNSGNTIRYLYRADGLLDHIVDPVDRKTTFTYDAGLVKTITDWRKRVVEYHYDQGRLASVDLPKLSSGAAAPRIAYGYPDLSGTYNDQLELATNLVTITDPTEVLAGGGFRVKFGYGPTGDDRDKVTSQKWPAPGNETATFQYNSATAVTVTDVLGQRRSYTLSATGDERMHIAEEHELGVPVWAGATFGQLPATLSAGAAQTSPAERVRRFTFENGMLKTSEMGLLSGSSFEAIRSTTNNYKSAPGAPGQVLASTSTAPAGTSNAARRIGTSALSPVPTIERTFLYQSDVPNPRPNSSTFLQAVLTNGRKIESPEPHRNNTDPVATNSSVAATETYNEHGQVEAMRSAGGTDTQSGGSKGAVDYFGADDPLQHQRGMPHYVYSGDKNDATALKTIIDYSVDDATITETDPRGTKTITTVDAWRRPVHVIVTKDGDPLTIDQQYFYDATGRLVRTLEKKGTDTVETRYTYDPLGRRTSSTRNGIMVNGNLGSITTTTAYDLANKQIRTSVTGGATTTTELDSIGRTKRTFIDAGSKPGASPIVEEVAYDLAGNRVYSSDMATAAASAFDAHGRQVGSMSSDGTMTLSELDDLGHPKKVTSLAADGAQIGQSSFDFTETGKLKKAETTVDAGVTRSTNFAWDGGGRTTSTATNGRASKAIFDSTGRMVEHSMGAGNLAALSEIFEKTAVKAHDGAMPRVSETTEKGGAAITSEVTRNAAGAPVNEKVGPLEWRKSFDELGNVTQAGVPGRPATKFDVDARGAVKSETLPGTPAQLFDYDASGAQTAFVDPTNEPTYTDTDLMGRPLRRDYKDGSSESIVWEGTRIKSVTDRRGRQQKFGYNAKGQLEAILDGNDNDTIIEKLVYDPAGRLVSWKNKDSELTWGSFDQEGHPKTTTQKRFRAGSGFAQSPQTLDEYSQQHVWNEHGERVAFSMPGAGWTKWVIEAHDAMGNVTSIKKADDSTGTNAIELMTASYRNAGRPDVRTVLAGGNVPIVRTYGYNPASSLMSKMDVQVGGITVAGSEVGYDGNGRTLQKSSVRLLGVSGGQRFARYNYDDRGRLTTSLYGSSDPNADPAAAVAGRAKENLTAADFRTAQERASQFDATTAAKLQEKNVDTSRIDPPTTTLAEKSGGGHKIEQVTKGPKVYPFGYAGPEVVDDGRFSYEFDVKGRMFQATEKTIGTTKRRVTYDYSATGRLIGRRAEYTTDGSTWKLEDRPEIVNADDLPAETTFVWDAITDRLITVVAANGVILKQIIHGDQSYDDPLETASIEPGTNAVNYLYPIYDEAGGGSLQAVLNKRGELVARNLPLDPYGGDNAALTGAAVDRVSVSAKKNSDGTLAQVTVEIRSTDALAAGTVAGGVRLATVDAGGALVRTTTVTPTLADANTVRWTLTPSQWTTLTAQPADALSVAVTASLRASSWSSGIPLLRAPEWIKATKSVLSSPSLPVEVRESLTSLTTFVNGTTTENTTKLYEIDNLALAVSGPGSETVFEDVLSARMHAHPFTEPMTGLDYVRARWYQPLSGTWLTPDPLGYRDSTNLYSFAGGDPINRRDPSGAGIWGDLKQAVVDEYTDVVSHAAVTGRAVKGIVKSSAKAVVGAAQMSAMMLGIPTPAAPTPIHAQIQMYKSLVAAKNAVAQWGTSAGEAISEPQLIKEAVTGLSTEDFAEETFDAAIITSAFVAPFEGAGAARTSGRVAAATRTATGAGGEISEATIMRSLRQSGSTEGQATAKLLKRGRVKLNLAETDPNYPGRATGSHVPGTDVINVALDQVKSAEQAAGVAAHETRHFLQKLNMQKYRKIHEFEAYQWQRSVDPAFGLADAEIWELLRNSPLYVHVPWN